MFKDKTKYSTSLAVKLLKMQGFPEISVRSLKQMVQEGLITPKRYSSSKKSHYVYTDKDIDRLKFILAIYYLIGRRRTLDFVNDEKFYGEEVDIAMIYHLLDRYVVRFQAIYHYLIHRKER